MRLNKQSFLQVALKLVFIFTVACLGLSTAMAQDAPPAGGDASPVHVKKKGPRTDQDAMADRLVPPTDEEVAVFMKAYKKLGRPSLLVLCGIDSRVAGLTHVGTQGIPMGNPDKTGGGEILLDTDPSGFAEQFSSSLMEPLNPDGRVKFKSLELLRAKVEEMKAQLKTSGEDEAMDVLGKSLGIDMIIYCKFTPRTPAQIAEDGRPFAAILQIKRPGDAVVISLGSFDVDGKLDNEMAKVYANAINKQRLIPRFGQLDAGRDITLGVLGVTTTEQASQYRKIIRKLDDVDGDVTQEMTETESGEKYASFEFSMSSGDVADLLDNFTAGVKEKFSTDVSVIKQESHTIMVRIGSAGGGAKPAWLDITETEKQNDVHDALVAKAKKSPKTIAVVVNWMVESNQLGWSDYWYRGNTLVPSVGAPQIDNKLIGPQSEELERMQGNISDLLNSVANGSFNVVDQSAVQAAIQTEVAKATGNHASENVIVGLKNSLKCDLIIWGKARLVSEADAADHRHAKMTFTIYDPATGRFLGSVNWNGDRNSLSKKESQGVPKTFFDEAKDPDGHNVARYVTGTLLSKWMNSKPMIDVEFRGADKVEQVQALADSLDRSVDDLGVFGVRYDQGMGSFTISFDGSPEDLKSKIQAKAKDLPNAKLSELLGNKMVFEFTKP